jgi:NitT/TauT family transport system substrate-binding protein
LKKLGLGRDAVVLREYGAGTRRIEAVRSGEITATAVNEPITTMAREQGLKAMVDLAADHIPWLFSGIVVKQSYLAAHRDVVTRFVKATMEGNYLALANERLAKEVLGRETGVTDQKIVDISYQDFKLQTPANIEPTRRAAENVIANYPPGGSSRVEDYVDAGIIEQLKKEGFVEALRRTYKR